MQFARCALALGSILAIAGPVGPARAAVTATIVEFAGDELMAAGNFRATEAAMLITLALAYAHADNPARAQKVANQTIELATERRQFLDVGRAQRAPALALLGQSGTAGAGAARRELDRALAQARQHECPLFEAQVMESSAELAEMLGDLQEQENRLHDAHRLWTAMGAQGHVDRLGSEIAQ